MTAARRAEPIGPDATDAELALAATTGDRTAFALIYQRYADRLHDFSIGMLRDRDAAADCVQDAFCTAAIKLTELRDPDKLRPWLYAVTRNEALRRIRDRRRELLSDEVPDMATTEAGPETLAARTELADLIAEAAGGLSDRDQSVLQLAYYHGLTGSELAEALDVSPGTANKLVQRLRDTVERSLGALLVCRATQYDADRCPELAVVLDGWDGRFTVLMRKRVARHIEECEVCDEERRRRVNPVALLGSTPVFIPAPDWLRERTLERAQLPTTATTMDPHTSSSRRAAVAAVVAATALVGIGTAVLWRQQGSASVVPLDFSAPATSTTSLPPMSLPPMSLTSTSRPPAALLPPTPPTMPSEPGPATTTQAVERRPIPPVRSDVPVIAESPTAIPRTTEPSATTRTTSTRTTAPTTRTTRSSESEQPSDVETTTQPIVTTRGLPSVSTRTFSPGTIVSTTEVPVG